MNAEVIRVCDKPKFAVIKTNESIDSLRKKLSNLVAYIEPDYVAKAFYIPNGPYFEYQWNLRSINVANAWDVTLGNESIVVAIIDTGIDYLHPDLSENYISSGYDWVTMTTIRWTTTVTVRTVLES